MIMDCEKKYKEALERAKKLYEKGTITESIGYIFPELAESEDERIRKALIELVKYSKKSCFEILKDKPFNVVSMDAMLVWLEKQGENKPFDYENATIVQKDFAPKVKPKFNVGDWIVWQDKYYKVNYNGCGYELVDQNGLSTSLEYGTIDENAHLWTIQDAKDGDVLASGQVVFMFKMIHGVWLNCYCSYCSLHNEGSFIPYSYDLLADKYFSEVYPATKEQRDTFFAKMKEARYEWDEKNKELKKIETKGGENERK